MLKACVPANCCSGCSERLETWSYLHAGAGCECLEQPAAMPASGLRVTRSASRIGRCRLSTIMADFFHGCLLSFVLLQQFSSEQHGSFSVPSSAVLRVARQRRASGGKAQQSCSGLCILRGDSRAADGAQAAPAQGSVIYWGAFGPVGRHSVSQGQLLLKNLQVICK